MSKALAVPFPFIPLAESCFTSTETVGLLGTGAQDGHPDFYTALEPALRLFFVVFKFYSSSALRDNVHIPVTEELALRRGCVRNK